MTAAPQLRLIRSIDIPAAPWWSHRLWRIREAASSARCRIMVAILAAVASAGTRERAWAEGFATGLGCQDARTRLQWLDEWRQGNEVAWDVRHDRGETGAPPPAPDGTGLVRAVLDYLGAATPGDRRIHGVSRLFALPAGLPSVPAGDHLEPAVPELAPGWLPLVAPRPAVVAEGRHAGARRAGSGHPQTPGRHARPGWRQLAARWFRQWHPAGAHAARSGPLSAAA